MAFYRISPFGAYRNDLNSAQICSVIANVNRNPKKQKKPFSVHDFVLNFAPKAAKKQSVEELKSILMGMVKDGNSNRRPRSKAKT